MWPLRCAAYLYQDKRNGNVALDSFIAASLPRDCSKTLVYEHNTMKKQLVAIDTITHLYARALIA